jgi:hypothetical protein
MHLCWYQEIAEHYGGFRSHPIGTVPIQIMGKCKTGFAKKSAVMKDDKGNAFTLKLLQLLLPDKQSGFLQFIQIRFYISSFINEILTQENCSLIIRR